MRTQETINKVKKAMSLDVKMTFNKAVFYSDNTTNMSKMNKKDAFEYLANISKAYVTIENSKRVVDSTIKKLLSLGFSLDLVESVTMPWGAVHYSVIINK
tara:strand:+ start:125 stop:424 length:300 start_codon:yes stop_codon:yes gene_type:complete